MDFQRPIEAVIPGVQGRILTVLAETTGELNLRTIARLADVSSAQASRVLPDLVTLGLVERREAPPSALFSLVEENVAARVVRQLSRARATVLGELGALGGAIEPGPLSIIVFGSLARGDADAESDVDVVVVRPSGIEEDDERWVSGIEAWRTSARWLTGNAIHVLEVNEADIARRLRRPNELWTDVQHEGVVVFGSSLEGLCGRRSA